MDELEALARAKHANRYLGAYDAPTWRVPPARGRRTASRKGPGLHFGQPLRRSARQGIRPWPASFAAPIRALIATSDNATKWGARLIAAGRKLYEVLSERWGPDLDGFTWGALTAEHCDAALALVKGRHTGDGTHTAARVLAQVVHYVQGCCLAPAFAWEHDVPDPSRAREQTLAGRAARHDRLPTREAIDALARLYRTPGLLWWEQVLVRIAGLLAVTGFRLGEVLSLEVDCLVPAVRHGRHVYGIRFANEKAAGTGRERPVRWLSPLAAQLARQLIDELLALTAGPRARALALEADPGRVPLPEPWNADEDIAIATLTTDVLGYTRNWSSARGQVGARLLRPYRFAKKARGGGADAHYIRVRDAEHVLVAERPALTHTAPDGRAVPLSRLLCLTYLQGIQGKFGAGPRTVQTRTLFVHPIPQQRVQAGLAGRTRDKSIFERHGLTYRDVDGVERPCRLRPHMLRHWLNTLANRAGMSAYQITQWMQRGDPKQTAAYLHGLLYDGTSADVAECAIEDVLDGRAYGRRADEVRRLPREEAREHLQSTLTTAYVVRSGYCTANFDTGDTCNFERACTADCPYHLGRTADGVAEEAVLVQLGSARRQRARFGVLLESGGRVAESQVRFVDRHIATLEEQIAAARRAAAAGGEGRHGSPAPAPESERGDDAAAA